MRLKDYGGALSHYRAAKAAAPELGHLIDSSIQLALKRLQQTPGTPPVQATTENRVDIVVPVFNALEDVKACLSSLARHADGFAVRVIVVNDGSDAETTGWLRCFCGGQPMFQLIEHGSNQGYTRAVNTGLRATTGEYVITQNSDTIVSAGWLKGMVACMRSDPKIGIVGPLSNAASWQNVPNLRDMSGSFAVNVLPDGMAPERMAELVTRVSRRDYPRLPFVNGFCFMIRRAVIESIGYMDEVNFPVGYGEENDFCIRASDAGFDLAVADDVFVFHAKSKSFGHERRKTLSEQGTRTLKQKHTPQKYAALVDRVKKTVLLDAVRERIQEALSRQTTEPAGHVAFMTMRVLFLLPVKGGGGGAHSVVQEVTEMRRLGMHACVGIRHEQMEGFIESYRDIPDAADTFVGFDDESLLDVVEDYDVVVGTIFTSMTLVRRIVDVYPHILPAYYVQDYEPLFFEAGTPKWQEARDSYTLIPDAFLFAKTQWIIDEVKREHGVTVHKVQPSIDHEVYKPVLRQRDGRLHVTAMVRPQTPRRGAERTMRLLARLHRAHGDALSFHIFGCAGDHPGFQQLERAFPFENHGPLTRPEVASVLGQSDIFIDLSDYQAFGRTALEAMACGCAAVVPLAGGASEYAVHEQTALVVDTLDEAACFDTVSTLCADRQRLTRLQRVGLITAARYSVHGAAVSECLALEPALQAHRATHAVLQRPTLHVFANRGSGGVPLGTGYVRLIFPYLPAGVRKAFRVKNITTLPPVTDGGTLLVQQHLPALDLAALRQFVQAWKSAGGRLIHDIDDDMLDAASLEARGVAGNAHEVVERVRLLATQADLVIASTRPLASKLRALNPNVAVVPNAIDRELWGLHRPRNHHQGEFARRGDVVRIGYVGTPTHVADLDLIAPAMKALADRFGKRIEIEVIGGFEKRPPTFGRRVGLPRRSDYPNFVRWLQARVHWDIAVIPLVDDEFNRSKSYLRFLECAALDMAMVVSDVPTYRDVARHGENCLLAQATTEDWIKQVAMLVEDASMRRSLASRARQDIIDQHTTDHLSVQLVQTLVRTASIS